MSEENRALVDRWFEEVWNQGRADAIDELLADHAISHGLLDESGKEIDTAAAFKHFYGRFREAFSDVVVTVEDTIAEGDKVVARYRLRARHTGDTLGVAATHKPIEYAGMGIVRIQDGKIVEAWNCFDDIGLYKQIGML